MIRLRPIHQKGDGNICAKLNQIIPRELPNNHVFHEKMGKGKEERRKVTLRVVKRKRRGKMTM